MIDALIYLAPGFLLQVLIATLLLWLFSNEKDEVSLGRILIVSIGFTVLNVLIEWTLQDYLLAATLVVQWCFFALLAKHFIAIKLPRAALTIFCYFMLLLGSQMLENKLTPDDLSDDEKLLLQGFEDTEKKPEGASGFDDWVVKLDANLIGSRSLQARQLILNSLYPQPEPEQKPQEPPTDVPPDQTAIAQAPTPAPLPPPDPDHPMTGKEFEKRFFSKSAPSIQETEEPQEPKDVEVIDPQPDTPLFTTEPDPGREPIRPTGRALIRAEEMSSIVDIRNRSTDPSYAAPDYDISALSIGDVGKFAIVDGEMLKEGSIIRTQIENPRGWLLLEIAPNEVFWQPLK